MTYQSGSAFRRALEDRLLSQSEQAKVPLLRLRKLVAFDRFLARLVQAHADQWLLKGGLALQLRLGVRARTTQDIDVLLLAPADEMHTMLVQAARLDLGDWFEFTVRSTIARLPGVGHGGQRFAVTALVDSRTFEAFHVDVGIGDAVVEPADSLTTPPILAFAGIAPTTILCYPLTQHLAEKVHAYMRPHGSGANTRVKDLVDILLIAENTQVTAAPLRAALAATFAARDDGSFPVRLPDPPPTWSTAFGRMAAEVGLTLDDLPSAIAAARQFLEPVLKGKTQGTWLPDAQAWT